jgi:hypothetical protein
VINRTKTFKTKLKHVKPPSIFSCFILWPSVIFSPHAKPFTLESWSLGPKSNRLSSAATHWVIVWTLNYMLSLLLRGFATMLRPFPMQVLWVSFLVKKVQYKQIRWCVIIFMMRDMLADSLGWKYLCYENYLKLPLGAFEPPHIHYSHWLLKCNFYMIWKHTESWNLVSINSNILRWHGTFGNCAAGNGLMHGSKLPLPLFCHCSLAIEILIVDEAVKYRELV